MKFLRLFLITLLAVTGGNAFGCHGRGGQRPGHHVHRGGHRHHGHGGGRCHGRRQARIAAAAAAAAPVAPAAAPAAAAGHHHGHHGFGRGHAAAPAGFAPRGARPASAVENLARRAQDEKDMARAIAESRETETSRKRREREEIQDALAVVASLQASENDGRERKERHEDADLLAQPQVPSRTRRSSRRSAALVSLPVPPSTPRRAVSFDEQVNAELDALGSVVARARAIAQEIEGSPKRRMESLATFKREHDVRAFPGVQSIIDITGLDEHYVNTFDAAVQGFANGTKGYESVAHRLASLERCFDRIVETVNSNRSEREERGQAVRAASAAAGSSAAPRGAFSASSMASAAGSSAAGSMHSHAA